MATTSRRAKPLLPAAAAAALLLLLAAALAGAQTPAQNCVSKLTDCAAFLNTTTTPPDTCCTPLKEVVNTQLTCLCNVLNSPGLLISMGIDVQKALQLTTRCGVSTDTSKCNGTATPPSSSTTAPPPPPTAGGESDAGRIAWSGILSLFLILASTMFY